MLQFQFVVCLFVRVSKKCGATWVWFLPIYWALWECEFGSKSEEKRKEKKEKMGYLKSVLFVLVMIIGVGAPLMVEAQLVTIDNLLSLIKIQGTVFCTANGNIGINATATPIFPSMLINLPISSF